MGRTPPQCPPAANIYGGSNYSMFQEIVNTVTSTADASRARDLLANMSLSSVVSTFTVTLVVFAIAVNLKNCPLVYHLRILNGVRFVLQSQRPKQGPVSYQLFQPLITSSRAPLMEIDVFGHKSNSTYFSDIDVCRVHLVTTLFGRAIEKLRGSTTMNGLSGQPRSAFTMPLGAVSCSFQRELKPYEKYDMWTRVLTWDEKWLYIVTYFVKAGAGIEPYSYTLYPGQGRKNRPSQSAARKKTWSDALCASALSKVVFKNGRITIAPGKMLELAGLLPSDSEGSTQKRGQSAPSFFDDGKVEGHGWYTNSKKALMVSKGSDTNSSSLPTQHTSANQNDRCWTRGTIETERQRGMEVAQLLAGQSALHDHFDAGPALGRHFDGHGIEGVVATLAQLSGLSPFQLL